MEWDKLLTDDRFELDLSRNNNGPKRNVTDLKGGYITTFQDDIERITYCSSFRRLQGKTQVHPLPANDYVRNRLTHSYETSYVGRVLGTAIGRWLEQSKHIDHKVHDPSDIGDIVAAACLAHDLGNPPFGHIGEFAIRSWFLEHAPKSGQSGNSKKHFSFVTEALSADNTAGDFLTFDGNAQGFRIITKLQNWRSKGGLRLTYAVLGAFTKYPFSSSVAESINYSGKFGFFRSDVSGFRSVAQKTGLTPKKIPAITPIVNQDEYWARHPLAYLVEAADDICYRTTDIEDGVKAGIVSEAKGMELLNSISQKKYKTRIDDIPSEAVFDKIAYIRSAAISTLMDDAIEVFVNKYDPIMRGNFSGSLLEGGSFNSNLKNIAEFSKKTLYTARSKVEVEVAGYRVIHGIMEEFADVFEGIKMWGEDGLNMRQRAVCALLPTEIKSRLNKDPTDLCMNLIDYVSGMTDQYAVRLYQQLSGVRVGGRAYTA
jgi:dGTPase